MIMFMRMRAILPAAAVLAGACAAGAAASPPVGVAECVRAMESGRYVVADPPGTQVLAAPFVARCRLPAAAAQRLQAGAGGPVLWIEGLGRPPEDGATVKVYLRGEGREERMAGAFTLLPDGGGGSPARVQVPLGEALAQVIGADGEFTVSLVAVDREGRPERSSLVFDRLVLALP